MSSQPARLHPLVNPMFGVGYRGEPEQAAAPVETESIVSRHQEVVQEDMRSRSDGHKSLTSKDDVFAQAELAATVEGVAESTQRATQPGRPFVSAPVPGDEHAQAKPKVSEAKGEKATFERPGTSSSVERIEKVVPARKSNDVLPSEVPPARREDQEARPASWRFTPLLEDSQQREAGVGSVSRLSAVPLPPMPLLSQSKVSLAVKMPPLVTEKPASDDVQIHIGRIEVIATPPVAPRVAAPPARRGQTLDEYLQIRNGRQR